MNKSAIAQSICLCLPSCCSGFESKARDKGFYSQILYQILSLNWVKYKNKQKEIVFADS